MFNINFYKFKKDDNSTKRPTGTGTVFSCQIIAPSSVINPTIKLTCDDTYFDYNYCYISEFNRYYFVNDVVYNNGFWLIYCNVDVLATYKTEIGAENLYILRSSAAADENIIDNFYPVKCNKTVNITLLDYDYPSFSGGYFVLNVAGKNTGSTTLYQLEPSNFATLIGQLLGRVDSETYTGDWVGLIESVKNSVFKPIDYINSVMWFPAAFPTSTTEAVKIGKWESGVTAGVISNTVKNIFYETVSLYKHPKAATRGAYLNAAPFSRYWVEFDPFGVIPLDASQLATCSSITISVYADAMTGAGILKIDGAGGTSATGPLASVTAQVGVQLPITQAGLTGGAISGAVTTIGAVAGAAATGGASLIAGAVSAGIGTVAEGIQNSVCTIGSAGSTAAIQMNKSFRAVFYDVADADNSKNGRPLMKDLKPSALGGYMIVQRGDVAIEGTAEEARQIKTLLEGGFYYE